MAYSFYTPPPSQPRTPSSSSMLPPELLHASSQWAQWSVPTPPMSSTLQKKHTVLPPITNFPVPPPTPPSDDFSPQPALFADANRPVDWLDFARERSARFIAEKTCEMICYLWFSSSPSTPSSQANQLQLVVTPTFITFLQKLLETTQVSKSVIVLSLHYIYRLKERNQWTPAQEGSEFRIAVAGLMMANKFLDDNTYTNKTWSEVSGISLTEINRMEREFLLGVDFDLYVSKPTYESWLNLLKGLVWAKERDSRRLVRKRRTTHPTPGKRKPHRARSTSPAHHLPLPPYSYSCTQPSPTKSGNKRSAAAAFSPTSAAFSSVPSKRPVSMILSIPETRFPAPSYSPLEQELKNMSIDSPVDAPAPCSPQGLGDRLRPEDRTRMMETARAPPGRLYFWTAASRTPPEPAVEEFPIVYADDGRAGKPKARLRYHSSYSIPPPVPSTFVTFHAPVAQSARASPNRPFAVHQADLPSFQDSIWRKEPQRQHEIDERRLPPLQRIDFNHQYYIPHRGTLDSAWRTPSQQVRMLEEMAKQYPLPQRW